MTFEDPAATARPPDEVTAVENERSRNQVRQANLKILKMIRAFPDRFPAWQAMTAAKRELEDARLNYRKARTKWLTYVEERKVLAEHGCYPTEETCSTPKHET